MQGSEYRSSTSVGLTVREVARLYRVSADKVRTWIRKGELGAIDTAEKGKSRFVILPEHRAAFEKGRTVTPPSPKPPRRPRSAVKDYFPD